MNEFSDFSFNFHQIREQLATMTAKKTREGYIAFLRRKFSKWQLGLPMAVNYLTARDQMIKDGIEDADTLSGRMLENWGVLGARNEEEVRAKELKKIEEGRSDLGCQRNLIAEYYRRALETEALLVAQTGSRKSSSNDIGSRLKWKKDLNLLAFLFERLEYLKFVEVPNDDLWAILSSIFLDKNNIPVTRDRLKQLAFNYRGNKSGGRPRNSAEIEKVLSDLSKQ